MALCGCASVSNRPGTPSLRVDIPDTCERVLTPVPLPHVSADDDARVAFMRDEAALIAANSRISVGRACIKDVRERYAGAGGK